MHDPRHVFLPAAERRLDADELAALAARVAPIDGVGEFTPQTVGEVFRLAFYPDARLLRLSDPAWDPADVCACFLEAADRLWRLDGTSPPIHDCNSVLGLRLTEAVAVDYLRFFCFFVRGEEGPFLIVADAEDPLIPPQVRNRGVDEHVESPRLFGTDSAGGVRASAVVLYSNTLFAADFVIEPGGMVRMADDTPLVSDLPAKVSAPLKVLGLRPRG